MQKRKRKYKGGIGNSLIQVLAEDIPALKHKVRKPTPPKNLVLLHKVQKGDITYYVVGKRIQDPQR
jgi:hypothetical protein